MLKDLKAFLLRGNVLDLAVGVVIGGAFGAIIASFVGDILTPLLATIIGKPDMSALMLGPVKIGSFINAVFNFLLVGTALFFVVSGVKKLSPPPPAAPAGPTEAELLAEIRDLLKSSR